MKRIWDHLLIAVGIVVVGGLAYGVWPTLYRYDRLGTGVVRTHRFTSVCDHLGGDGWTPMTAQPSSDAENQCRIDAEELPPIELAKLRQGDSSNRYSLLRGNVYNGSNYRVDTLRVAVSVFEPRGNIFDQMSREDKGAPAPAKFDELGASSVAIMAPVFVDREYKASLLASPHEAKDFQCALGVTLKPGQTCSWKIVGARGQKEAKP